MIISLIVAMDENRGIGKNNRIPWHLNSDLKHFKVITMGHHLIMGRKTYESIGKPLPGRQIIILTRNLSYSVENCLVVHSVDEALAVARSGGESEVFICGGSTVFTKFLASADQIYLTVVHTKTQADTFFPIYNPEEWLESEVTHYEAGEKDQYPFTFKRLIRRVGARPLDKSWITRYKPTQ